MGGLAFDTQGARGVYLPVGCPLLLFFTQKGIRLLCKMHPKIFEQITVGQIDDKSKANGFGKALVCIQALWFMA